MRRSGIIFLMILLTGTGLWAQRQKPVPRPPIFGIPAKTLPKGLWVIRGYWIHPFFDKKLDASTGEMVPMPDNISFTSNTVFAKVRYGITPKLTAILNVPFLDNKMSLPDITKNGTGIGDIIGALLWKFHHNKEKRFLTSLLFYTKWPSGVSTGLSPDQLPLGTGSYDAGLALLPEKEFGRWDMRWSAFYVFRSKNRSDVNLGDVMQFSWSTAYNAGKRFIGETSLVYKQTWQNRKDGTAIEGSASHLFQLIPGAQYRITRPFLIQFALPVTLSGKMPFTPAVTTWVGLYYLF